MNQVIILAGGHGKRMKAAIPKPMLQVLDVPMLGWVIRACEGAGLSRICVVTGYKAQSCSDAGRKIHAGIHRRQHTGALR